MRLGYSGSDFTSSAYYQLRTEQWTATTSTESFFRCFEPSSGATIMTGVNIYINCDTLSTSSDWNHQIVTFGNNVTDTTGSGMATARPEFSNSCQIVDGFNSADVTRLTFIDSGGNNQPTTNKIRVFGVNYS